VESATVSRSIEAIARPSLPGIPPALWERAAAATRAFLLLDYDGTLVPLRAERLEARPSSHTLDLLRAIVAGGRTAVAVVSGRPVGELGRLLRSLPVHLVGEHGWEERPPRGALIRHPLPEGAAQALHAAAAAAATAGFGHLLERKRSSLMLHTRGRARRESAAALRSCRRTWGDSILRAGLRPRRVRGGLEIRVPGRDKGTAVRDVLRAAPARSVAAYLGDDETDEDAFRALGSDGFGIRVGRSRRPSAAGGRLDSAKAVPRFLATWLAVVQAGSLARGAGR
jgi:trehalose-phosphatase